MYFLEQKFHRKLADLEKTDYLKVNSQKKVIKVSRASGKNNFGTGNYRI